MAMIAAYMGARDGDTASNMLLLIKEVCEYPAKGLYAWNQSDADWKDNMKVM